MTTSRFTSRLLVPRLGCRGARALLVRARARFGLQALPDAARKLPRGVVALELQEVVSCRDLDQHRQVPSGAYGHLDVGQRDPQDLVAPLVEAQAIVALARLPGVEPDHELEELVASHGGHPEQVLDV